MTTDLFSKKKSPRKDWSDVVEEDLKRGSVLQNTSSAFPSLDEASKAPTTQKGQTRKKRNQPQQKISLQEFIAGDGTSGSASSVFRPGQDRGLTDAQLQMSLPTGPRPKDPNQSQTRNWGGRQGGYSSGGAGRYDREDRRRYDRDDEDGRSRADESRHWGADRQAAGGRSHDRPPSRGSNWGGYDDKDRDGSYGGGRGDSENWSHSRFQPSHRPYEEKQRRGYGFHSGGGGGGGGGGYPSRHDDRWSQRSSTMTPPLSEGSSQGRRPLMLTKRTKPLTEGPEIAPARSKNNPFADARPREDVLRERGTSSDVYSSKSDIASDQDFRSQPGSPGGSYRGSSVAGTDTKAEAPQPRRREDPFGGAKPREDPFGGAKPREVVLSERISRSGRGTPSSVDH